MPGLQGQGFTRWGEGLQLPLESALWVPASISGAPEEVPGNLRSPAVFLRPWEGFVEFGSHLGPRGCG